MCAHGSGDSARAPAPNTFQATDSQVAAVRPRPSGRPHPGRSRRCCPAKLLAKLPRNKALVSAPACAPPPPPPLLSVCTLFLQVRGPGALGSLLPQGRPRARPGTPGGATPHTRLLWAGLPSAPARFCARGRLSAKEHSSTAPCPRIAVLVPGTALHPGMGPTDRRWPKHRQELGGWRASVFHIPTLLPPPSLARRVSPLLKSLAKVEIKPQPLPQAQ